MEIDQGFSPRGISSRILSVPDPASYRAAACSRLAGTLHLQPYVSSQDLTPRRIPDTEAHSRNQEKPKEYGIVNIVFNKIVESLKNVVTRVQMETRLKKDLMKTCGARGTDSCPYLTGDHKVGAERRL